MRGQLLLQLLVTDSVMTVVHTPLDTFVFLYPRTSILLALHLVRRDLNDGKCRKFVTVFGFRPALNVRATGIRADVFRVCF